ncbi:non-ribosomal peptide synthetase [Rhodococcoides fascians]|uniref:non-ribosomal peptide synthetase n=1 Tax=Rhodococcoides fascians TaxID=1828 RepID=UPI00056623DE|nr:non-ribosomal peptide synthetase [Rhodococcus fascians]
MKHDALPLSTPQVDIWYAQHLVPDIPFAIAYYVELNGNIDVDALLDSGVRAHVEYGSVSMRVRDDGRRPVQTFTTDVRDATAVVDLRGDDSARDTALRWMDQDCRTRFPLDGCLVRLRLFRLADDHVLWYTRAHHIALDGYASVRVLERAASIYDAVVSGKEPPAADVSTPEAVVDEDRKYQASARATRDREYWRASAVESARSAGVTLGSVAAPQAMSTTIVGAGASPDLENLAGSPTAGHATSSIVIAAFAAFLARMTDSADVRLSLPVSARSTAVLRRAGFTTSNVVPLELVGIGRTTVGGAVKMTETALGSVLRHQRRRPDAGPSALGDLRFPAVSFGPTVNVMMFSNSIAVGGIDGQVHILTTGPVVDLAVDIYPDRGDRGPRIDFEGNPSVYPRRDLARHHRRFLHFLDLFTAPNVTDTAVGDLDLFLPDESSTAAASVGATVDANTTLIDVFDEAVRLVGNGIAVDDGATVLTYWDLNERVDRLARVLRHRGIEAEDTVAVCMSRTVDSVIAFWAVARAGAVFVPIDPRLPDDRIEFVLRDSHAVIGLAARSEAPAAASGLEWVLVDDAVEQASLHDDQVSSRARPGNAAYVIYTSGSTGTPKGVVVTLEGVAGLVQQIRSSYALDPTSRVCHLASLGFDTSVVEQLAAAVAGACLVVAPSDVYAGDELTNLLADRRVTHLFITPSALATLDASALDDVGTIVIGGESSSTDIVDAWAPGRRLLNAYGPTETTCSVTMTGPLSAAAAADAGIGTAMVGAVLHLLDRNMRPVPPGAIGEIYIATAGVARGYADRAAATASRFVAYPFGGTGVRMFRSGDMARLAAHGSLVFVGRIDDQVKIRGNRVELGEVDAALRRYPNVVSAASALRRGGRGETQIDGYVVCDGVGSLDSQDIRRFVAKILPAHAVPATVTAVESIPLTVNRKLDRAALPEPVADTASGSIEEPAEPLEVVVAQIFTTVLQVERVDVTASFFDLGGDSLAATGVVARLRAELGVDVGVRDLVGARTVRALAAIIATRTRDRSSMDRAISGESNGVAVVPLSTSQVDIDRDCRLPLYNLPFTVDITGPFDVSAAEAAFVDVLVRHRTLRTVHPDSPWGPRQIVVDDMARLQSVLGRASFDAHALAGVLEAPFDVRFEMPIRATLFDTAPGAHVLACAVHHIAADAWSLGVLAHDFSVAYRARASGDAPAWTDLPLQYADHSVWDSQRSHASALDFWRRELSGLAFDTEIGTDRARPQEWDFTGGRVEFDLVGGDVEDVNLLARRCDTGRFTVLRAALVVLVSTMTGRTDIAIGTPIAGRDDPRYDPLVGMFVNTLAIRTDITHTTTFADVVAAAHVSETRALDHSSVPFDRVAAELDPGTHPTRHPLFQIALSLDVFTASHVDVGGTRFDVTPRPLEFAKCDLHMHVVERRDKAGEVSGLSFALVYPTALFDHGTVRSIGERYVEILQRMIQNPADTWTTESSLLSPRRRRRMVQSADG